MSSEHILQPGSFEIAPSLEIEAEPAFPLPLQNPGVERAKRPHSRGRRLLGGLAGVVIIGFTLLMVWIMMFDGAPPTDWYALYTREWYYDDCYAEYHAWNFWIPNCLWKQRIDGNSGAVLAGAATEEVVGVALGVAPLVISLLAGLAAVPTWKRLVALDEAWQAAYPSVSHGK